LLNKIISKIEKEKSRVLLTLGLYKLVLMDLHSFIFLGGAGSPSKYLTYHELVEGLAAKFTRRSFCVGGLLPSAAWA